MIHSVGLVCSGFHYVRTYSTHVTHTCICIAFTYLGIAISVYIVSMLMYIVSMLTHIQYFARIVVRNTYLQLLGVQT
jgi:hypothetical protein